MSDTHQGVIVTGASGGVGSVLCAELAQRGLHVLALGRDEARLAACRAQHPARIRTLAVDVTVAEERKRVRDWAASEGSLRFLVHAAATLEPICRADELSLSAFQRTQALNVEAPLFLSLALAPLLAGGRILQLSSGAAHEPLAGCLSYSVSKAALHMVYRCLQRELAGHGVLVGSASPGAVDTPMQTLLRESDERVVPDAGRFRAMASAGSLERPARSARFLAWLLLEASAEVFSARDWSVRDAQLWPFWDRAGDE